MDRNRWRDRNGTSFDVGSRVSYAPHYKITGVITGVQVVGGNPHPFLEIPMGYCFPVVPAFVQVETGGE